MLDDVPDPFGVHSGVLSGYVWANFRSKFSEPKIFNFKNFRIVWLREAKRGSAGVPVAKCEAAGDTQSVQEMTM